MQHLFELGHRDIAFISGPLALGSARPGLRPFKLRCWIMASRSVAAGCKRAIIALRADITR